MSSTTSTALKTYKKFPFLKNIYFFYNIYIRNFKYLLGGSKFNEENTIFNYFKKGYKGNYVDAGCFHPTKFSNTRKMHNAGWNGLNIDFNPLTIDLFNFVRPEAINLCAALSNKTKKTKIYHHHDLSPQNTLNKDHVRWMESHFGLKKFRSKTVKTQILMNILKKYNFKNIDFLNIDIEGHEFEVISSINFKKLKIKLICIEILGFNKNQKKRKNKLKKFLKRKGFRLKNRIGSNYIFQGK